MTDADEIRRLLARVELVTLADLARRWGCTRSFAHECARREDFPAPVVTIADGSSHPVKLYLAAEAQAWYDDPARKRRAGRKPNSQAQVKG